jgi:hypothetical protein
MGTYTKVKKYRTKFKDDECRIPGIDESRFLHNDSFLNHCRAKHAKMGNPFGCKKGVIPIECRECPIGEKIVAGQDIMPVNIKTLQVSNGTK